MDVSILHNWYRIRDLNPQHSDSKSDASAYWTNPASLHSLCIYYIHFLETFQVFFLAYLAREASKLAMAPVKRLELLQTVLETDVLPLHQTGIWYLGVDLNH